jgi:hypothetical protein
MAPRGVFRHGESLYVLFDASTGVSLATAFEFLGRSGLRLSSEAVLRIASAALAALDCVSGSTSGTAEGYHGLFTPENLFIAEDQVVRVRGFGMWADGGLTRTGLLGPGDLRYLAPGERATGLGSARTDLLSLGMMMFEAVVGFPAFDAPPEEEDLAELRSSVEELQRKADTSMQDLYQVILSCLTPPGLITMPYRARLRKVVDTLFVREAARDRPFGALTLEDLIGRVKQRRPAIVKAIPMSLLPADSQGAARPEPPAHLTSEAAEEDLSAGSEPSLSAEPEDLPQRLPSPSPPPRPARGRRIPASLWMFAGAAVAMAALAVIFWNSWPRTDQPAASTRPTAPAAEGSPLSAASSLPAVTAAEATPLSAIPTSAPPPEPTALPSRPTPEPARIASAQRPVAPAAGTRTRRPAPSKARAERLATALPPEGTSPPAAAARGEALVSAPSAVVAGALLPLATPGLSRPVLLVKPENPRYGSSDSKPAVERSVQLEILVNDLGRVRGNRIVRADSLPPGFFGLLERHLAGLRFRPAELGGVPVKVWMPYELRYWAP